MESLEDAGKSDAVVSAAGKAGSVTSEHDANSKGTAGSMESCSVVEEVYVVRSSGSNPQSGDPDEGNTNSRRFLRTPISKTPGAITHSKCCEIGQNLLNKGFISWDLNLVPRAFSV